MTHEQHELIHLMTEKHNDGRRLGLANNIFGSMGYATKENSGLSSVQRCMFPLRGALYVYRTQKSKQLAPCEKLYQDLTDKNGIQFAARISRTAGRWSELEREAAKREAVRVEEREQ